MLLKTLVLKMFVYEKKFKFNFILCVCVNHLILNDDVVR